MLQQFDTNGIQPQEMLRPNTAHYCCFNLQGWIHLARLAQTCGEDLWSFQSNEGRGIQCAMKWLLAHIVRSYSYPQIDTFDSERFFPVYYAYAAQYGEVPLAQAALNIPAANEVKPAFPSHDGIAPFWQLLHRAML